MSDSTSPGSGPAGSSPEGSRILGRLIERLRGLRPEWAGRPEDPATVLLEIWAGELARLERAVESTEQGLGDELLGLMGIEPASPEPARALAHFTAPDLSSPRRLAPGTRLQVELEGGRAASFETAAAVWLTPARLLRAYATRRTSFEPLPVPAPDSPVSAGESRRPFTASPGSGRYLYLGDRRLEQLGSSRRPLAIHWEDAPLALGERAWEYRTASGWRELPAEFELVESERSARLLMVLQGPLAGLEARKLHGARLPWLRASLPPREVLNLRLPRIEGDLRPHGLASEVERLLADSSGRLEDLSYTREDVRLEPRPRSQDPALYLGFDHPGPLTLHVSLEPGETDPRLLRHQPRPPDWVWEIASGPDWRPLATTDLADGTLGFRRSGTIEVRASEGWSPRSLFGDRLHWLRARWADGEYLDAPAFRELRTGVIEIVQRETLAARALPVHSRAPGGWTRPGEAAEGTMLDFESVSVVDAAGRELLLGPGGPDLLEDGRRASGFVRRRAPDGQLEVAWKSGEEGPGSVARADLVRPRFTLGARGNGAITRIAPGPGDGASWRARALEPARGGRDAESIDSLRRRAPLVALRGDRLVHREDFLREARALLPGIERIHVTAGSGGGVAVLLISAETSPGDRGSSDARSRSLRAHLELRSPPGLGVEVRGVIAHRRVFEVVVGGSWRDREVERLSSDDLAELGEELLERLGRALDLEPGRAGSGGCFLLEDHLDPASLEVAFGRGDGRADELEIHAISLDPDTSVADSGGDTRPGVLPETNGRSPTLRTAGGGRSGEASRISWIERIEVRSSRMESGGD